jgi:hypothetical protein
MTANPAVTKASPKGEKHKVTLYTLASVKHEGDNWATRKVGVYKVKADDMTLGECISEHDAEPEARAAMRRYQEADKRRARHD